MIMMIIMMMVMHIIKMEINETEGVHRRTGFDSLGRTLFKYNTIYK